MKQFRALTACLLFAISPSLAFPMNEQVEEEQQDSYEIYFFTNSKNSELSLTDNQYINDTIYWFSKIPENRMGISGKREAIMRKVKDDASKTIPNYSTNEKLTYLIQSLEANYTYFTNKEFFKAIVNIYNTMGKILNHGGASYHRLRNFSIIFTVTVILVVICLFGGRYLVSEHNKTLQIEACENFNMQGEYKPTANREFPQKIDMDKDILSHLVKIYTERSDFNYPDICQVAQENRTFVAKLDYVNGETHYLSFKRKVTAKILAINRVINKKEIEEISWHYLDDESQTKGV